MFCDNINFVRGETPTISFEVVDVVVDGARVQEIPVDFSDAIDVNVAFEQYKHVVVEKTLLDGDISISENVVGVYLSQEDTLKLHEGPAEVQINWIYANGHIPPGRSVTERVIIHVDKNLIGRVMT